MASLFRTETTERLVSLLFLTPSRVFTLGEIVSALGNGASRRTIIYTIDQLVAEGFVTKSDVERGWPTYRANERSFAFDELRSLATKMFGAGEDIPAAIRASADVIGAAIYGSTAAGAARADSDIDVLLVVRDAASISLADLTATLYEAGLKAGRAVNCTIFERSEFAAKRGSGFLARVLEGPLVILREDEPLFTGRS